MSNEIEPLVSVVACEIVEYAANVRREISAIDIARIIQYSIPVGEMFGYLHDEGECLCHQYDDHSFCRRCTLLAKLEPKP